MKEWGCGVLLLAFASSASYAQTASEQGKPDWQPGNAISPGTEIERFNLEDLLNNKVSVSSLHLESETDAPSSVTVFTHDEIKRMAVSSLEELLNYVPGFTVTNDTIQAKTVRINVRGISSSFQTHILFLIDGQPLNDMFAGISTFFDRNITLENVERVEIIRGPGSALYGANAFAAVVNIVTIAGATTLAVSMGDIGRKSLAANFSRTFTLFNHPLTITAFAQGYSDDGYVFRSVTDSLGHKASTSDPFQAFNVSANIGYRGFSLSFRNVQSETRGFLGYGALGPFDQGQWRHTYVGLGYARTFLQERVSLDSGIRWAEEYMNVLVLLIPAGTQLGPFNFASEYVGGPVLDTMGIRAHADVGVRFGHGNRLNLGASYDYRFIHDASNVQNYNPQTLQYAGGIHAWTGALNWVDPGTAQHLLGAYVQDQQDVRNFLSLTAGLRVDWNGVYGTAASPRAAIVFKTPFHSTIKMMYGRAFLAPNFSELYEKNNPSYVGTPTLKPQYIDTVELGLSQSYKTIISGTITPFYSHVSDLIVLGAPLTGLPVRPFVNKGDLDTSGLDLELKLSPIKNLLLRANYTTLFFARSSGMTTKLEEPQNSASAIANYSVYHFNFNASVYIRQKSELFPQQNAYAVVSGRVGYLFTNAISVSAAMENIGDTQYLGYSTSIPMAGVPHRGRTFFFEARFED